MGVVFLAERTDLGSHAAIKISADAWLSPARRQRFAAEQRTLASLNHPSIAPLYDAGALSNGTPWIVMEYGGEGMPLICPAAPREHDSRTAATVPTTSATPCQDRASASGDPSGHQAVEHPGHRGRTVKLVDFGISKQLDERGVSRGHDADRCPHDDAGLRGARTDSRRRGRRAQRTCTSLGVVLYELLNGRLPGADLRVRTDWPIASLGRTARARSRCCA